MTNEQLVAFIKSIWYSSLSALQESVRNARCAGMSEEGVQNIFKPQHDFNDFLLGMANQFKDK